MSGTVSTVSTFHDVQFPTDISYGSKGGPQFNTTVLELSSGQEQRNINWSAVRCAYDISYGIKTPSQTMAVIAFFYSRYGKAYGFRYKDWADYQLQGEQIGVGDGTTTTFQVTKTYVSGPGSYVRNIYKPVNGTLAQLTVSGAVPNPYPALDNSTGQLIFAAPPPVGAPIVIGYMEFDVPVRFDIDKLDITAEFFDISTMDGLNVVEIRL